MHCAAVLLDIEHRHHTLAVALLWIIELSFSSARVGECRNPIPASDDSTALSRSGPIRVAKKDLKTGLNGKRSCPRLSAAPPGNKRWSRANTRGQADPDRTDRNRSRAPQLLM